MALHIPDDKLAEIRNAADIVEMIAARVFLKKAGKDFSGLCPFHAEKTPSFTVSPDKQIFHCFGCGSGGDIFNFLMKYDGVSFPEAVQAVARQYGIVLPTREMPPEQRKQITERENLLALNHKVMGFYQNLLSKGPQGVQARRYLKERGFSQEIIDAHALGFAPPGWDNLIRFLSRSRISMQLAEKAGLIVPKKQKGHYDRFRNRIIFPILDLTGQVIGFGGRVMDDAKPKYLNSPETPLYHKGSVLYGLNAAKKKCRSEGCVFIVEGYFDLLAMHQHGVTNSVATLGTALTRHHIRRLSRAVGSGDKRAVLVFDSDEAGINAAKRTMGSFLEESMEAAVVLLPKGHDPDTYLFEYGRAAFDQLAQAAPSLFEFLIDNAIAAHGLTIEGKVRIIGEMSQIMTEIKDNVARSVYIRHLAERIGVDETAVLEKVRASQNTGSLRKASEVGRDADGNRQAPTAAQMAPEPPDRMEKQIVAMMLQHSDIIQEIEAQGIIGYFEDVRLKSLAELVRRIIGQNAGTVTDVLSHIEDEHQRQMIASLLIEEVCWSAESCSLLLNQFLNCKQKRQTDLLKQIRVAEESNDHELLVKLLSQKQKQAAGRR